MNIARNLFKVHNQSVGKTFHRKFRFSAINYNSAESTQAELQEEFPEHEKLKYYEREERKKPAIGPFMKNVFMSEFNRNLMPYPEILNKEEFERLDKRASGLNTVFSDPNKTMEDKKNALKTTRMYAGPVCYRNNGLDMNCTESLRYLESMSSDLALGMEMSDHWVALEALRHGLPKEQYQQIIGDLITGDRTIALCIKETLPTRMTQQDVRTYAELDNHDIWRINGEKIAAKHDGYLLVLCRVEAERTKAFLVHPGVTGTIFTDGRVIFKNVAGTLLDQVGDVELSRILGKSRLYSACLTRSVLRRGIMACREFIISKINGGRPLYDVSSIKKIVGEALMNMYASESAEYFTAGLIDGYMNADAEVEMAMCRNFIARIGSSSLTRLTEVFAMEDEELCSRLHNDMRSITMHNEFEDSVNIFIALNGLHHAGKQLAEEIKSIRNPVFNPGFVIRKMLSNRLQEKDDPKLDLFLAEFLHPSLKISAENLEYCVMRMRYACESIMSRYGSEVADACPDLLRLAEAGTEIYATTAVLSRASRSYCIGVRNAEVEMKMAGCFADRSKARVKRLVREIDDGEYMNLDAAKISIAKKMIELAGVPYEPPTTRVYW